MVGALEVAQSNGFNQLYESAGEIEPLTLNEVHEPDPNLCDGQRPGETLSEYIERKNPGTWFRGWARQWMTFSRSRSWKKGRGAVKSVGITYDDIAAMGAAQNYRCAVSGLPFVSTDEKRHPFAPSIDRIDSSIGYEPGNVRVVCLIVNYGMSNYGDEAFIRMCRAVAAHNPE